MRRRRSRPRACEIWGDVGRCGEVWGGVGRCGERRGDTGRYGEMYGDMGGEEETWRDVGRSGERGGDMARCGEICTLSIIWPPLACPPLARAPRRLHLGSACAISRNLACACAGRVQGPWTPELCFFCADSSLVLPLLTSILSSSAPSSIDTSSMTETGRYGEMRGDAGRDGEIRGDIPRLGFATRPRSGRGGAGAAVTACP